MTNKLGTKLSVILLLATVVILATGVIGFGLMPIAPILVVVGMIMIVARTQGVSWRDSQQALIKGIESGLTPLFLFLLIGALIALWLATGVIPTMIWVGFKLLTPTFFLPTAFLTTSIVGALIGSAFTTLSTVGVSLMGVGTLMGMNPALVAGIVLSGAIFGDKSSPLSDSTNLASAISETDLFAHIKNLMWTTVPAWGLTFLVSVVLSFGHHTTAHATQKIAALLPLLQPTLWAVVPLGLLVITAWFKIPAIPALMLNIIVSSAAFLTQHSITVWANLLVKGFKTTSHNPTLMALLNRGGMSAMMDTIMMIMLALALGGLLSGLGILNTVMAPIVAHLRSQRAIVLATLLTGISANFLVGEQYLSTILPGQLFKESFKTVKLSPLALGRTIEDSGTVMNYLVPWGVAGAFAAQTLGVPVVQFAPYTLFALLSPIMSILSAITGIGLKQREL
ncbi:sodium:proton antiporter [Leuconostoc citreum]|jgi:NhaC family Na+:H+ antiporter|uniref:Sodium:proton antiporter n=1 Tax=Leuconostoc citreum TaxID=33964 RepID=A0A5A5U3K3_LEUCI|nr:MULTISPECIES: Na+/H+ antiporter NhaC family protein [Leuconostoc]KAF0260539.1 sodium:proton antiporter [Leuconostoc citreum]MBA5937701.1 sodium:proton antiporter [Leuconostoc citreum]MBE4726079.1 sodium:proton antiporter [Leuconostoc citreum]MCK8605859.1 sodium:proton antiporter [Leuconostoc citreum]MCT3070093.1 sodium:proton antiporter [Leuconostoc citreum]